MNKYVALTLIVFACSGCRTLNKLTDSEKHFTSPETYADVYTVTGVTKNDFYCVRPVRVRDSAIRAWVKTPDATEYRELNKYEFTAEVIGTETGRVTFKREAYPTYDSNGTLIRLVLTGRQAAPPGTAYRIQSMLLTSNDAPRLY